jgi:flagellar biosynthesis component FlhA
MRRIPAWKYLIGIFAVFWVILAIMMFIADFPFYVISLALTTILVLSIAIVALAWAYQNNW